MSKRYQLQLKDYEARSINSTDTCLTFYYALNDCKEGITVMKLQGIEDLLNKQEEQLQRYKGLFHDVQSSDDDLECLLGLMQDNNLTWGAICKIVEEALP